MESGALEPTERDRVEMAKEAHGSDCSLATTKENNGEP